MIILENQDERSPLKSEGEIDTTTPPSAALLLATAPPPSYVPTLPPNPIVPSYQAVLHSHHVTLPRRHLTIRRLHVAFAIACLVLLLCGASMYGFYKTAISSFQSTSSHLPNGLSLNSFKFQRHLYQLLCAPTTASLHFDNAPSDALDDERDNTLQKMQLPMTVTSAMAEDKDKDKDKKEF